ncbi:Pyrroline-5-carboxylate reductase [Roseimaritima multifibrata]|uniref:Pyrroline-5-carboxylate reductase n=1 Tax=Roseimaritima multifibrata TaxID=1930274 RepID=A0A517MKU2_9BACT|nr:pyrroline-5-carboxylate reductase [Roseimaritima multifibrata]QDS95509.1 Pyrroline-5-carboxylate reductase [Roseimaritima multifibrata]
MKTIAGKLTLVGGGRMGRALVEGMIRAGVIESTRVTVINRTAESCQVWTESKLGVCVEQADPATLKAAVESAETVIVAVKPGTFPSVAESAAGAWAGRLVISVAAGVKLATLQKIFDSKSVVRVMPNTPSLVGFGASAFSCGPKVSEAQAKTVEQILAAVGVVAQVEESALDAVTGLSGSGPAYIFMIIEALADGGVAAGLPRALAQQFAAQTVLGAAQMVTQTGDHPALLKDAVASPGGTTIAGLAALEQNGLRSAMIEAVRTAAARSREMGNS